MRSFAINVSRSQCLSSDKADAVESLSLKCSGDKAAADKSVVLLLAEIRTLESRTRFSVRHASLGLHPRFAQSDVTRSAKLVQTVCTAGVDWDSKDRDVPGRSTLNKEAKRCA